MAGDGTIDQKARMRVEQMGKGLASVEAMLRVDQDAFHDALLNIWAAPVYVEHGKVFGLFDGGTLVGLTIFMRAWDDPRHAHLVEIAVATEHQAMGWGTYLLRESLDRLRGQVSTVSLTVDPNNARAVHVYQDKLGFRVSEFRKDQYGEGKDRYYMVLKLDDVGAAIG